MATFRFKYDKKITMTKTIRFPIRLVEKIEKVLEGTESTFSSFIIQACEFALENMEKEKTEEKKQEKEKTHS